MKDQYQNYNFSADKNRQLIKERGISFEDIVTALDSGKLLNTIDNPNSGKYPHQKMYVVEVNDYVYLVPFVRQNETTIFLKTIFPSRRAKKQYLKGASHEN
jgi:uncharacterized DUF497 family protein